MLALAIPVGVIVALVLIAQTRRRLKIVETRLGILEAAPGAATRAAVETPIIIQLIELKVVIRRLGSHQKLRVGGKLDFA